MKVVLNAVTFIVIVLIIYCGCGGVSCGCGGVSCGCSGINVIMVKVFGKLCIFGDCV